MDDKLERFREHWAEEMDGAATYRALAERASDQQREILLELAAAAVRHARQWAGMLEAAGHPVPDAERHRPSFRTRVLCWVARRLGPGAVLPIVQRAEFADASQYDRVPEATSAMAADERIHARVLAGMTGTTAPERITRRERWHRASTSGTLRAAVFGVNDGLVSNLALIMGVAGARPGGGVVLLAGLAGLLAGAFSMGAGEYISMRSQREMFEREIALESEEIESRPDEEENELALIYRAKGMSKEDAEAVAARIMTDKSVALDTLAREELGLNPDELGSPWGAALSSFTAFSGGALIPLAPYLLGSGTAALLGAVAAASVALFAVGAAISVLTGRSLLVSGLRQLLVGGLAAVVTYAVGTAIGVAGL